MKFSYGTSDLFFKLEAEKNCYLLTNGLGGYSSTTIISSLTRQDHSLFVAAIKVPDIRYKIVNKLKEYLHIDGVKYDLSSQSYVDYTKNEKGNIYLVNFSYEYLPVFTYFVSGVTLIKTVVMEHLSNTIGVKYEIINEFNQVVDLEVVPVYSFVDRQNVLSVNQKFVIKEEVVESNNIKLNIKSNANKIIIDDEINFENDYYFEYDAKDGRPSVGSGVTQSRYFFTTSKTSDFEIVFSLEDINKSTDELIETEVKRLVSIVEKSNAKSDLSKTLVLASDKYIVKRESTSSLTVVAGYPFFIDWGRDTMFAVEGLCLSTNRYSEAKSILSTFIKHLKNGLMPNLFPEGDNPPMYNTVDTSLLFIQTVYTYYKKTNDIQYVKEVYDTIKEIIYYYEFGTDNDIYMDKDYLIKAGSGTLQLTWMDVCYKGILPTPRHGKAVEINAFWYNSLNVIIEFSKLLNKDYSHYEELAKNVIVSFNELFWNEKEECLKDVVSGDLHDFQVRSNQIWAISTDFSPLDKEKSKKVLAKVSKELYTPYGLRTLSTKDNEFKCEYSGTLEKRDMSYHQGTVWTFPLGSFFRAYLKVNDYSKTSIEEVRRGLSYFSDSLREGCVGQIAEIYDGLYPTNSRGCFAQAWSVSEILKISLELDEY